MGGERRVKWFCNNCEKLIDRVKDQKIYQFSTTCPHCDASQSKNQSTVADWCDAVASTYDARCRFVTEQVRLLKRVAIASENGVCSGMVSIWLGLYHGRLDNRHEVLDEFIEIYEGSADPIVGRHIEIGAIITFNNKTIDKINENKNLIKEKLELIGNIETSIYDSVPIIDISLGLEQISDIKSEHNRRLIKDHDQFEQQQRLAIKSIEEEISKLTEYDREKIDEMEHEQATLKRMMAGNIGFSACDTYDIAELFIQIDMMLGQAGYYVLGLDEDRKEKLNAIGHQMAFISGKGFFLFMDPNTGEFISKNASKMKRIIQQHMSDLYANKYKTLEIIKLS